MLEAFWKKWIHGLPTIHHRRNSPAQIWGLETEMTQIDDDPPHSLTTHHNPWPCITNHHGDSGMARTAISN
ncbi:unnamed protein product [Linum trigynum]|uniref:Uncharacterized protein n=1 Tax=Linum trigynum TaxID=586398 RepID=A0AAV2EW66_9ROSI